MRHLLPGPRPSPGPPGQYTETMRLLIPVLLLLSASASAQTPCPATPTYTPCEITVQLTPQEAQQHPNPYRTVELYAEVRSPEYKTYRVPAFWDGSKMVLRFSPDEPGDWTYRITSNLASADAKTGKFTATKSDSLGFIRPANVHHWIRTENRKPHLWMGDTCEACASMDRAQFEQTVNRMAEAKFTHIRMPVMPWGDGTKRAYPTPDTPDAAYFRELDSRVAFINAKGIITDLVLGGSSNTLTKFFVDRAQRERYLDYVVARYTPYNVTWQLVEDYESYDHARDFARELGLRLKELDYTRHPKSTHTQHSSGVLVDDGWMDYILYNSADDALGILESQQYGLPRVNAGVTSNDPAAFRKRLWNATMNGQWPTVAGGDPKVMTAWFDFFSKTRYWELEPYFDVDGGRAFALPDVEYIVYIEKPGPVEIQVEKHSYQVYWLDPATGEITKEKKDFKDFVWKGSPPTNDRDWVLHLSRDGRKEGMLNSYKFESRPILPQEPELNPRNMPFELVTPKNGETVVAGQPVPFEIRTTKKTPGTRRMTYLIKGDVAAGRQGFRYYASGEKGTFTVPPEVFESGPTTLMLRVFALNAPGKVYALDYVFQVTKK